MAQRGKIGVQFVCKKIQPPAITDTIKKNYNGDRPNKKEGRRSQVRIVSHGWNAGTGGEKDRKKGRKKERESRALAAAAAAVAAVGDGTGAGAATRTCFEICFSDAPLRISRIGLFSSRLYHHYIANSLLV